MHVNGEPNADVKSGLGHDSAAIDATVLAGLRDLRLDGEPDILAELVELFRADTPVRLATIRQAVERRDSTALKRAVHALKGSCLNMGASTAAALCVDLEARVRSGALEGMASIVDQLELESERACHALECEVRRAAI